jgi:hypothetical protein
MASRVFFLYRLRVRLRGPHLADLRVDLQKLLVQGLVLAKLLDLSLGLTYGGRIGQRLSDGPSMELIGETEVGSVTWSIGLMAAAIGLAASTGGGSDGAATQVAEGGDLIGDPGAPGCKGFQGFGQRH